MNVYQKVNNKYANGPTTTVVGTKQSFTPARSTSRQFRWHKGGLLPDPPVSFPPVSGLLSSGLPSTRKQNLVQLPCYQSVSFVGEVDTVGGEDASGLVLRIVGP